MVSSTRLAEMMQRVKDYFEPYSLEDYIVDNNPQSIYEVEALERKWHTLQQQFAMLARRF